MADLPEMRIEMSEKEIVLILKDLFSDYGAHVGLTTGERHQVEMWLQEKYLEAAEDKNIKVVVKVKPMSFHFKEGVLKCEDNIEVIKK